MHAPQPAHLPVAITSAARDSSKLILLELIAIAIKNNNI
jgi:hypothetical protein